MIDLDAYVANLRATYAEATVETNFHAAKLFVNWLATRNLDLATASEHVLHEFVEAMVKDGYSAASIVRYAQCLKPLHAYASRQGIQVRRWYIPKKPRVRHKMPTILRGDQLAEFDLRARDYPEPWATMLRLLPLTALRPGELRPLERRDIEIPSAAEVWLVVRGVAGKGNQKSKSDRRVPLLRDGVAILRAYLSAVRPRLPRCNLLFPSPSLDASGKPRPTSASRMESHVKAIGEALGVELSPYDLRHTAITYLAERNVDPKVIQAIAGHQDFATTQRYIHLSPGYIHRGVQGVETPWVSDEDDQD